VTARLAIALALAGACGIAACGGERTFDAEEFVTELNDEGATLALGEPLPGSDRGIELYALSFTEADGAEVGEPGEDEHSGGTLALTADAEAAAAEFRRCDRAVTLTCYRAANAVLYFEGEPTDPGIAAVDTAIRALAEG
jgi:hypothetical protein